MAHSERRPRSAAPRPHTAPVGVDFTEAGPPRLYAPSTAPRPHGVPVGEDATEAGRSRLYAPGKPQAVEFRKIPPVCSHNTVCATANLFSQPARWRSAPDHSYTPRRRSGYNRSWPFSVSAIQTVKVCRSNRLDTDKHGGIGNAVAHYAPNNRISRCGSPVRRSDLCYQFTARLGLELRWRCLE